MDEYRPPNPGAGPAPRRPVEGDSTGDNPHQTAGEQAAPGLGPQSEPQDAPSGLGGPAATPMRLDESSSPTEGPPPGTAPASPVPSHIGGGERPSGPTGGVFSDFAPSLERLVASYQARLEEAGQVVWK